MNSPFGVNDHVYTEDQLADIREASELERMTQMAGWVRVSAFMAGLVEAAQQQVASVNTMNEKVCADAVMKMQMQDKRLAAQQQMTTQKLEASGEDTDIKTQIELAKAALMTAIKLSEEKDGKK